MSIISDLIVWLATGLFKLKIGKIAKQIENDPELQRDLVKHRKMSADLKAKLEDFCKDDPTHPLCTDDPEERLRRARERDAREREIRMQVMQLRKKYNRSR